MASSIQLNSTNNSEMKIEYQGTSGVPKTVVVPDRNMTVAGTDEVIGVNQTWQDVTASRALGINYTNTTGKSIQISVGYTPSINSYSNVYVAGVLVASTYQVASQGTNTGTVIVPNGAAYQVASTGGVISAFGWKELR